MGESVRVQLRDGAELWTAISGSGPPVVCLHGGPGLWDYLAPLACLLDGEFAVVRFDQRGCGRSSGRHGPFTIEQAVEDLEQVRTAYGVVQWAVVGHSWGAELALRYAARHPRWTTAVVYIAGVGAGDDYERPLVVELNRRLGPDRERWAALSAIPDHDRTLAEEQERCLLQWRTDFSPGPQASRHAQALWQTRPAGALINTAANRRLWQDRACTDLREDATRVTCPVTMIFGHDDPRPWVTSDSVLAALPAATRTVLLGAGHAPWVERPADVQAVITSALRSPSPDQTA